MTSYPDHLHLLIGGRARSGEGRASMPVVNPATEETLGALPLATKQDLDDALAAAHESFPAWRALGANPRGAILRKAAQLMRERGEDIARVAVMEQGKSIHQMRIEVEMSAQIFEWYAEEGRRAYGRVLQPVTPGTRIITTTPAVATGTAPRSTRSATRAICAGSTNVTRLLSRIAMRSPEYRQAFEHNMDQITAAYAKVLSSMSARQREKTAEEFDDLRRTLRKLMDRPETALLNIPAAHANTA